MVSIVVLVSHFKRQYLLHKYMMEKLEMLEIKEIDSHL